MFGPGELDAKNIYKPNLDDINESAKRTYGEANSFFKKEELYLKEIERQLVTGELSSEEQIYDECHAIASDLAKCCEMYLKALFLYEHRDGSLKCNELWAILEAKMKEDKTKEDGRVRDKNGNVVYYQTTKDQNGYEIPLRHSDGTIIYVYAKVDSLGNLIKDSDGNQIYVDKLGNEYKENNKGKAVKTNGHALDRLVELMLPESRLLLETRMLTIPMATTEKNSSVSILDKLQENGLLSSTEHISQEQFVGWLDQHKKTFEESRFSGQKEYDVSVEFMYHLATQIKAVVQYVMFPTKNQQFTITNEDLLKLPPEIRQLASFNSKLISEALIKLIISDDNIKNKIIKLLSQQYILPDGISQKNFYEMLKSFNIDEINYVCCLCYMAKNYQQLKSRVTTDAMSNLKKVFKIASLFNTFKMSSNKIIGLCIQIKSILGITIGSRNFDLLFEKLIGDKLYNYYKAYNNNTYIFDENFINNNFKL